MILKFGFNDIFKESFLKNFSTNIPISLVCSTLIYSFLIALFIYYIYKLTTKSLIYSKNFNTSMCIMCIITSGIVLSMQANITVSLGMVGALSIVRFRTAVKEPRDLLFLFWSISSGIIIGSGVFAMAIILAIVVAISLLFFDLFPEKKSPYLLVVYFKNVKLRDVEIVLSSNKIKYNLKSENISSKESCYIFEVNINKNKDFVEEVMKIKGVSEVNLLNQNYENN